MKHRLHIGPIGLFTVKRLQIDTNLLLRATSRSVNDGLLKGINNECRMTLHDLKIQKADCNDSFAILGCDAYLTSKLHRNYYRQTKTVCT